ncbi:MAG: hypothetical protein WC901_00900 [Candidatus Margulisiibacteriota bacterium]
MSYCRWSSNNGQCDVYVYENAAGGWYTHIAGRRKVFRGVPDLPLKSFGQIKYCTESKKVIYKTKLHKCATLSYLRLWMFWHKWVHGRIERIIPYKTIGLPNDGETIIDNSPLECANTLIKLKEIGYLVPLSVIDNLIEESIFG